MGQININIILDNIDPNLSAHEVANLIENIIKQNTGIGDVRITTYDNDSSSSSNPIFASNIMRRIK